MKLYYQQKNASLTKTELPGSQPFPPWTKRNAELGAQVAPAAAPSIVHSPSQEVLDLLACRLQAGLEAHRRDLAATGVNPSTRTEIEEAEFGEVQQSRRTAGGRSE
jgi:hypothetical protein